MSTTITDNNQSIYNSISKKNISNVNRCLKSNQPNNLDYRHNLQQNQIAEYKKYIDTQTETFNAVKAIMDELISFIQNTASGLASTRNQIKQKADANFAQQQQMQQQQMQQQQMQQQQMQQQQYAPPYPQQYTQRYPQQYTQPYPQQNTE